MCTGISSSSFYFKFKLPLNSNHFSTILRTTSSSARPSLIVKGEDALYSSNLSNPNTLSVIGLRVSAAKAFCAEGCDAQSPVELAGERMNRNDLVLFSHKNIGSSIGQHAIWKNKITKLMFELTPYLESVLVGLILSDGWILYDRTPTSNHSIAFTQAYPKNLDFFYFVYLILSHILLSNPLFQKRKRKDNYNSSLSL